MGFYRNTIFPRLLDAAMTMPALASRRRQLLSSVNGDILEIGFGTGANLPYYPKHVKKILAVDSNEGMASLAGKRVQASGREVEHHVLDAERLPFLDGNFDSVVTTWTICSVENPGSVFTEIKRVLKTDGRLFFLEHGKSPDEKVLRWQKRLTPINRVLAAGCELTRDIPALIHIAGFEIEALEMYYIETLPKTHGYMYQGIARKN